MPANTIATTVTDDGTFTTVRLDWNPSLGPVEYTTLTAGSTVVSWSATRAGGAPDLGPFQFVVTDGEGGETFLSARGKGGSQPSACAVTGAPSMALDALSDSVLWLDTPDGSDAPNVIVRVVVEMATDGATAGSPAGIVSGSIDGNNHLILVLADDSEVDCGDISQSGTGFRAASVLGGHLILIREDNSTLDCGIAKGDGLGVVAAEVDGKGHLVLTLSDSTRVDCGLVDGSYLPSPPVLSQIVLRSPSANGTYGPYLLVDTGSFPRNLAGSRAIALDAPGTTATRVELFVQRAGITAAQSLGRYTFGVSGASGTFSAGPSGPVSFSPGDYLTAVVGPQVDVSVTSIGIAALGVRGGTGSI